MGDVARRTLDAWQRHGAALRQQRGLLALAFDLPNHGTRMVNVAGNLSWDEGNENHALDMIGMVKGAKQDLAILMDLIEGYLGRGRVERHMALGWSLGGHSVWQAWFDEERLDAAVVVVGCPDFIGVLSSYQGLCLSSFYCVLTLYKASWTIESASTTAIPS